MLATIVTVTTMKEECPMRVRPKIRPDFTYKIAKIRIAIFTIKKIVNISRDPKQLDLAKR